MQQTFLIPLAFALTQDPQQQNSPAPAERQGGDPGPAGTPGTQTPGGPPAAPQQPCGGEMLYLVPVMLLLMYFMAIKPEQKRKKQAAQMMAELRSGDTVVTIGGMHGILERIDDRTVVLRVDNTRVTIDKSAIARVQRDETARPEIK